MSIKTSQLEKQKVPKLRFASFAGEWKEETLGNIVDVRDGTHDSPKYQKTGYPLITSKNLMASGVINFEDVNLISTEDFVQINKRSKVDSGDILFGMIGTIGNPVIVEDNNFAIKNVALIKEKQNLENKYLYQYLKSVYIEKQFHEKNAGGTQKFIALGVIRDLKIPVPVLVEQQKIASFLGLVDRWIENLKEQKENLELYKKGICQQVFNQKISFRDGNGNKFPAWEQKKLSDIVRIYDGTHQTPTYVDKGIPFYSVEHLTANNFSNTKFISSDIFEKENKKVKLEKNDILMTRIGDIGTARIIDWDVDASFYVSLALIKQSEKVSSSFLSHYINAINFQKELWKRTIHVAFPKKINLGEIGECKVLIPSFLEQQKIADFLTSVDKVIESKQQQISQAEQWKKGLMQQLFV